MDAMLRSGWAADIRFVLEVQKRPCLYDRRLKEYRNQDGRQLAWREIGEVLNIPVDVCPGKWKSIRDKYLRLYKKNGLGADEVIEDPTWIVSKYLSFLNPCLKPKRAAGKYSEFMAKESRQCSRSLRSTCDDGNIPSGTLEETTESHTAGNDSGTETGIELHPIFKDNRNKNSTSTSQILEMTDFFASPGNEIIHGKRKHMHENNMDLILEALKAPIVLPPHQTSKETETDADELFLMSLLPDLKKIKGKNKTKVKIQMLSLIDEAQEP